MADPFSAFSLTSPNFTKLPQRGKTILSTSSLLRTSFLHNLSFRLFHFCHQQMVVLTLFELAQLLWTSTEQLWFHRVLHSFPLFSLASCESHFITTLLPFYSIFPLTLIIMFLYPSFFWFKNKQIIAHTHPLKPRPSCKVLWVLLSLIPKLFSVLCCCPISNPSNGCF